LDSIPLLLQKNSGGYSVYPQAAFDGHNFLVVRNVRSYYQSTLDATPDVPSGRAGPERVNAMPIQQACRLAWNGFSAVRVNTEGQIIDPNDITFAPDYGATTTPGLAFGDGVYVVTHNARYVSWLLSTEGVVLDSVSHSNSGRAQVCFDGTNFLLLCQEYSAVTGMRLSPEGILLDSVPFPLVNAGYYDPDAHIAASAAGHVGLVFCGFEPNPLLARRIRAVTFPAIVGISSERDATPAAAFRVLPNPASRLALLSFNLTQAGPVCVTAFDAAGRKCASLFSGRMNAGMQTVPLDTRRLANGVYFLRLEAGTTTHSTRLVVSR
jgi:hypothetical protein